MFQHSPPAAVRLLALALLASSASLAAAQIAREPSQAAPAPSPPAPAPSSSAQGAPGAQPLPARTQSAIKLAGLVTFVANSCPKLQPNYARFIDAINALGLSKTDLDKPDLKAGYIGYAARYNTDVKTNCARAAAQFGPHGATLVGIFSAR